MTPNRTGSPHRRLGPGRRPPRGRTRVPLAETAFDADGALHPDYVEAVDAAVRDLTELVAGRAAAV